MTTKFVGMKDFRQNMAKYTKKAHEENIKYIVLKRNVPMLEISPVDVEAYAYEKFAKEFDRAEKEIREGKFVTAEEIMKKYNIEP